jgi:hypothetical protein
MSFGDEDRRVEEVIALAAEWLAAPARRESSAGLQVHHA